MKKEIIIAFEQGKIQAICGFPGIGKSYLANKHPMQFQDCFYSKCRYFNRAISALEKPEYPMNWINRVKDAVKNGKIVVVGCNPDSRAILNSLGLNYLLVYPPISDKSRYFHIYDTRNDEVDCIDLNKNRFDSYIEYLQNEKVHEGSFKEELPPGWTLSQYMEFVLYDIMKLEP